jgi:hypothetical protein
MIFFILGQLYFQFSTAISSLKAILPKQVLSYFEDNISQNFSEITRKVFVSLVLFLELYIISRINTYIYTP